MEICDFLQPEAVLCLSDSEEIAKNDILDRMARIAEDLYAIDGEMAASALRERESASSTGLGQGIALPHARSQRFDRIMGVFIKLETPTEYASPDGMPVDLLFCIFAPDTNSVDYLQSLGNVARLLRSEDVRARLRSASDAATVHQILTVTGESH